MRLPLRFLHWVFSRENLLAFLLALLIFALLIVTADSSPLWIYQGF
jgi:lipopolysaccharide/colanic/teichoic acid biosynthesis glycosyltransferase